MDITLDDIGRKSGDELDALLADPEIVPAEKIVYICMDGRKRRQYEEVKARIEARAEEAAAAAAEADEQGARAAAGTATDDRLSTKGPRPAGEPAPPVRDPEQDLLEQLVRDMKAKTVPFVVESVGSPRWNDLVAAHPPRKDTATGRYDPRDIAGGAFFNVSTFYVALVRESIVSPEMTDARYASLLKKVTDQQFDKLAQAAADVNRQEPDDLPF